MEPTDLVPDSPKLADLYREFEAHHIPIGPLEIGRIRHVLEAHETIEFEQLREWLALLLTKSEEQREPFAEAFDSWLSRIQSRTGSGSILPPPRVPTEPTHRERFVLAAMLCGLLFAAIVLGLCAALLRSRGEANPNVAEVVDSQQVESDPPAPTPSPIEGVPPFTPFFYSWIVDPQDIEIVPPTFWSRRPALVEQYLMGMAALAIAMGSWWMYRRQTTLPKIIPRTADDPDRWLASLLEANDDRPALERTTAKQLAFGVSSYIADDHTDQIDIPATVAGMARAAGYIDPIYRRERHTREVRLWLEQSLLNDREIERFVTAIELALTNAAVVVRVGRFNLVPNVITYSDGLVFDVEAEPNAGGSALIAVLTTFEFVSKGARRFGWLQRTPEVWRRLAERLHLGVFDCGVGSELQAWGESYGLRVLHREALPGFLASVSEWASAPRQRDELISNEYDRVGLMEWAGALCLGREIVAQSRALQLRDDLNLCAPGIGMTALAQSTRARISMGSVSYEFADQAQFLERLGRSGSLPRVLAWWRTQYAERRDQERAALGLRFERSRFAGDLEFRESLLDLWDAPEKAAARLRNLHGGAWRAAVRDTVGQYAAADWEGADRAAATQSRIVLPWNWSSLPIATQRILDDIGFGGLRERVRIDDRIPQRLGLSMASCVGVAAALWISAWIPRSSDGSIRFEQPYPEFESAVFQSTVIQEAIPLAGDQTRLRLGTAKGTTKIDMAIPPDSVVRVKRWQFAKQPNLPTLAFLAPGLGILVLGAGTGRSNGDDMADVYLAGTLPIPIRAAEKLFPRHAVVFLQFAQDNPVALRLAGRLLDRGSADIVVVGPGLLRAGEMGVQLSLDLLGIPPLSRNVWIVADEALGNRITFKDHSIELSLITDSAALQAAYDKLDPSRILQPGIENSIINVSYALGIEKNDPTYRGGFPFRQGPEVWRDEKTKIDLVHVGAGTFLMGALDSGENDESPSHPMTVPDFWIARTETTRSQYARGRDDLLASKPDFPVAGVSWSASNSYCQSNEFVLPTEAQWEYAARAGSITKYYFGDDELDISNFENYQTTGTAVVGSKIANAIGLFDVNGNVLEWCGDIYDKRLYSQRPGIESKDRTTIDKQVESGSEFRVIRGGSAWSGAWGLRSADRDGNRPEFSNLSLGFRCARLARRPP